jgi:hypothetical protein
VTISLPDDPQQQFETDNLGSLTATIPVDASLVTLGITYPGAPMWNSTYIDWVYSGDHTTATIWINDVGPYPVILEALDCIDKFRSVCHPIEAEVDFYDPLDSSLNIPPATLSGTATTVLLPKPLQDLQIAAVSQDGRALVYAAPFPSRTPDGDHFYFFFEGGRP